MLYFLIAVYILICILYDPFINMISTEIAFKDKYTIQDLIGSGSFGKVYKARRKFTGHIVAMKFITKKGKTEKELKNLRQEIAILQRWFAT